MQAPAGIGFYYTAAGRERYLALYQRVAGFGPAPVESLDVPTGFGTVRAYRHGPVQGSAPIVLLPGGWATAASWAPNIAELAARHPVYSIDVLGQPGYSLQTFPVRSAADCACWLGEVLTTLAPDRPVHLVGASYGGWLAFNQAMRAPDAVKSVTLIEPANTLARFSARFVLGALTQAPGVPRTLTDRFYQWVLGGPSQDPFTTLFAKLLTEGIRNYRAYVAIPSYPSDAVLRSVRVPVLALLGGQSVVHNVASAQHRSQDLLPYGEAHVWPDATHGLPVEFVDEVNARILDFVGRHSAHTSPDRDR